MKLKWKYQITTTQKLWDWIMQTKYIMPTEAEWKIIKNYKPCTSNKE